VTPALNRFPSAKGGKGFAPIAQKVHDLGLKFGIHIMRGMPRLAVEQNLPVLGTNVHARDIADTSSICSWNPDMYGLDMSKPGAQAYYDSIFALYASWGVDFIKMDDMSRPYDAHAAEIEAAHQALVDHGRRPPPSRPEDARPPHQQGGARRQLDELRERAAFRGGWDARLDGESGGNEGLLPGAVQYLGGAEGGWVQARCARDFRGGWGQGPVDWGGDRQGDWGFQHVTTIARGGAVSADSIDFGVSGEALRHRCVDG
jgi:hypothetical protein